VDAQQRRPAHEPTGMLCEVVGGPWPDLLGLPVPWRWSVNDLSGFWSAFREYADLGDAPELALASNSMPGASWFPGSE